MNRRSSHDVSVPTNPAPSPDPDPEPEPDLDPNPYDFSMEHVPADWVEAQLESPLGKGDPRPLSSAARFSSIPTRAESTFIPNIVALGASFIGGTAWYFIEILSLYRGPWLAVGVGAFIALAVRLTGMGEQTYRAVVSVSAYLLTTFAALVLITYRDLSTIYGSGYNFSEFEDAVVATRIENLSSLLALLLGGLVAGSIGFLRRGQRS